MPKVKVTDDELNIPELEDAEYNEGGDFDSYEGALPDDNTILTGYIKSMWWTMTKNNDRMFKVLFVAADNEGEEAEFDGLPIWDNPFFSPSGKFRWQPFIDNFDLTLLDIKKKLYLEPEENDHERFGSVVQKVGTLVPGGDTSWARVLTKIGFDQNDVRRVEIKKWLPLEDEDEVVDEEEPEDVDDVEGDEPEDDVDEDDVDDEDEDEDDEDEDYDEDEDEDEEDEDEEPEPPKRGRRPAPKAAKAAPARTAKPAAKTAAPARGARTAKPAARSAAPARKTAKAAAPARGGRRTAKASQNEPPF